METSRNTDVCEEQELRPYIQLSWPPCPHGAQQHLRWAMTGRLDLKTSQTPEELAVEADSQVGATLGWGQHLTVLLRWGGVRQGPH